MICTKEDTKLINEIMRDFTNITKIAAIFVNNRGKVLSQEYNFSPFCKVVRRNPTYAKRCNQCDLYGGLDATKELSSCPYRCHMGLIDFSRAHHERWRHLRLHHGRTNKNRRYNNQTYFAYPNRLA